MLDRFLDFILSLIKDVLPFFVIRPYESAVVFRGGKTYRVCTAGFYWKIPFYDDPFVVIVNATTEPIGVQSFITKDRKQIATKAVCKYEIDDVVKYVEKVYDAKNALIDTSQGHIMRIINARTWEECADVDDISNKITIAVRRDVKKYGIFVEQITLTDLVEAPSYRFFMDGLLNTKE